MTFGAIAVLACLLTILGGLALTQPLELRDFRWTKIALSLPLVVLVTSVFYELQGVRGYFGLWSIAIIAFIWKGPLAHYCSLGFMRLLHGDMNRNTGIRAELGGAKSFFKRADYPDALRLTLAELEKEPLHYEGLLLLCDIYEATEKMELALQPLEKLLENADLSPAQVAMIQARKKKIEDQLLIAGLNKR